MAIFHILSSAEWTSALAAGIYSPAGLAKDGFIHLCEDRQLLAVARRYFRDQSDLLVLSLREDQLHAEVRREIVHDEVFPHLYGTLNLEAVIEVAALLRSPSGNFALPNEWLPFRR